ncbi:MAG: hypothetical protein H7Z42_14440 [Roseiflexaceae bacterium]|nr:hypothetical protein [Roseiflexaceae bacterium]
MKLNASTTNSTNVSTNPEDTLFEYQLVDPETLLLVMFDIEELAVLTPGELRLLGAVAAAAVEDASESSDHTSAHEYAALARTLLTQPRSQEVPEPTPTPLRRREHKESVEHR